MSGAAAESAARLAAATASKHYFIEISISESRLSLFERTPQGALRLAKQYKVGTPARGIPAFPFGRGRITKVELNPWWEPTAYTRQIYRKERGIILPKRVPPGDPLNYMGPFKLHLSHKTWRGVLYRIHGNNNPNRIGKRVTGGCICMDNTEGMALAKMVPVGTEVNIIR